MLGQPAARERDLQRTAPGFELDRRQRARPPAPMQQHGQPQQHDEELGLQVPGRNEVLDGLGIELAPVPAHDGGEQLLFLARKARQVGMLQQIGAMVMVVGVGDVEPDLVQTCRPAQHRLGQGLDERPVLAHLPQERESGLLHAVGLRHVDVEAGFHGPHATHARILVGQAAEQVVEQPLAQRPVRDSQGFDAEHVEDLNEDGQPARDDLETLGCEPGQLEPGDVPGPQALLEQPLDAVAGDVAARRAARLEHVAHRAHRSRRPEGGIPLRAPEPRLHGFEFELRRRPGALHALLRDSAVREVLGARADAADVQAVEPLGGESLANDEFGAAAANVHDQPVPTLARRRVRHPQVDEARLLDAGDDLDRVPEGLARPVQECTFALRLAQGVGADDAHLLRLHVLEPLAEPLEARQGPAARLAVQPAVRVEAGGQSHHFAQAIDDDQLAVRIPCDDHVKAVGPEVHSCKDVGVLGVGTSQPGFRRRRMNRSRRSCWRSDCG